MRAEAAREQDHFAKEFNLLALAGAGGFEPPYGGIKIRCLTAWRRPNVPQDWSGPAEGGRTIVPAFAHRNGWRGDFPSLRRERRNRERRPPCAPMDRRVASPGLRTRGSR